MIQFLLATYGLTLIVTQSKIFKPLRARFAGSFFGDLLKCPMCFGFWAGLFWSRLWPVTPMPSLLGWEAALLHVLAAGCAASGFCWIVRVTLHRLGEDEL